MIKTTSTIAAAYADAILNTLWERQDKETTDSVLETVRFLMDNYDKKPEDGISTEDKLLGNLLALEAAVMRTKRMNEVIDLEDEYFVSILKRF